MSNLPVKLLEAGACYNGNSFLKCALNPSECASGSSTVFTYRTSRWLGLFPDDARAAGCTSQASIHGLRAMGRCAAKSDRHICTSDASACQLSAAWSPFDPECTVVDDLEQRGFDSAYFGECTRSDTTESFCAWQSSECPPDGRFQWANPFFANSVPDCRCDDVKTGACVADADPTGDFFCAVTEEVCTAEEGFSYRTAPEVEAELGATCKLCDALPPPPATALVAAGACTSGGAFRRCALAPAHCDAGERFLPAASVLDPRVATPPAAAACATPDGVKGTRVGRCDAQSNFYMCVPDASACNIPQYFKENDPECTVAEDLRSNTAQNTRAESGSTHYGFCSFNEAAWGIFDAKESHCVWSSEDCASSSIYDARMFYFDASPGTADSQPGCRCSDVRTGACISRTDPTQRYCAVRDDACNLDEWTFVNWRDLANLVCTLCADLPDPPPSAMEGPPATAASLPPPSPGVPTPLSPPSAPASLSPPSVPDSVPASEPDPLSSASESEETGAETGLSGGAIAGFIGGAVGGAVLVFAAYFLVRGSTAASPKNGTEGKRDEEAPVSTLPSQQEKTEIDPPGQTEEDFVPQEDHSVN